MTALGDIAAIGRCARGLGGRKKRKKKEGLSAGVLTGSFFLFSLLSSI